MGEKKKRLTEYEVRGVGGGGGSRGRRPLGGDHVDYVNSGSFGEEESESGLEEEERKEGREDVNRSERRKGRRDGGKEGRRGECRREKKLTQMILMCED